jgi:hypothetical protein
MPTTPHYALRYPLSSDPADGPLGFNNLATDVDNVLFGTIWTPLDNRLKTLEAVGPPPAAPTTNSGELVLSADVGLPATIWTPILSTPSLAVGRWLLLAQVQVAATDITNPGHTTCHIVGATTTTLKSSSGGWPDQGGTLPLTLQLIAQVATAQAFKLEAYNSNGKSKVTIQTPNPEQGTATRFAYVRLA